MANKVRSCGRSVQAMIWLANDRLGTGTSKQ
jgi:hypothetical protein